MLSWTNRRVKRTPSVLQMEAVECGAAALGIVLAHHGAWVPLEELRLACGVSRDGSKASNILKAARRFGLAAKGFSKEPSDLRDVTMPCIVHWNFNHFVVLEGIKGKRVYINDPAMGRRRLDLSELDLAFTGVVLLFERTDNFVRRGRKPQGLRTLIRELRGSPAAVTLLAFSSLALVVPGLLIPAFIKIFVDDILVQDNTGWVVPLLIGMAVTALFRAATVALQQSVLLRLQTKLTVIMTSRFLWRLMSLPMQFFYQRHAGDIASRVAMNEEIARLLSGGVAANAVNLASIVFFAVAMIAYDAPLAAIGIGICLLNVVALKLFSRRRTDLTSRLAVQWAKLVSSTVAIVRTIETVKASGLEDEAFAQWAGVQARALNAEQEFGIFANVLAAVPTLLTGVTTAAVLGFGGLRVIEGHMTLGTLVAFQSLIASFVGPIASLIGQLGSLQEIKGSMERLQDVYNYPGTEAIRKGDSGVSDRAKLVGTLTLEDLEFGYSTVEPPLLADVSLSVEAGKRVALVGPSGSGKSTIGKLICGIYQPWRGRVCIDGRDVREIPPEIFANSVAYVDQDIFLFEGTARENLTLWDATVAEAVLFRALSDAAIHEEIATRPGNYDCHVAEGGINFSGGQRQRIEIARALVTNPSLIVLDEATAALDPITEKIIEDNVRRRGCSCLIIAHRLSTVRDCDEIIVLDRGRIVERGTHAELVEAGGPYARLVASE